MQTTGGVKLMLSNIAPFSTKPFPNFYVYTHQPLKDTMISYHKYIVLLSITNKLPTRSSMMSSGDL